MDVLLDIHECQEGSIGARSDDKDERTEGSQQDNILEWLFLVPSFWQIMQRELRG